MESSEGPLDKMTDAAKAKYIPPHLCNNPEAKNPQVIAVKRRKSDRKGYPNPTYFLMLSIRSTIIHTSMNEFIQPHNISSLDPHITLALIEAPGDISKLVEILDTLTIPKIAVHASNLVFISPASKLKKCRLAKYTAEQLPKGQLLADVSISTADLARLDATIFKQSFWKDFPVIFQKELHVTFEKSKGLMRNKQVFEHLVRSDEENVFFGDIVCDEVQLCEMNSVDGLYTVVYSKALI